MANPPITGAVKPPAPSPRFNETAIAIGVSFVIAILLATVVTGNPLRASRLAYTDYRGTPATGAAKASTTNAPATATAPAKP